jgi:hypothetical protein
MIKRQGMASVAKRVNQKMQATPRRTSGQAVLVCAASMGARPSTVAKSGVLPAVGSGPTSRCPLLRFPAMIPSGLAASCGEKPMQTRLVGNSQKRPRCSVDSGFLGVWNLESHLNIISPQYESMGCGGEETMSVRPIFDVPGHKKNQRY